jgi:2-phospho-L-lactate guanylyltransferase
MTELTTILPLKAFDQAKARLSSVLSPSERSRLARLMAVDVLRTLSAVPEITGVLIAGQDDEHAALAAAFGCDFICDDPALDVSSNVARVTQTVIASGVDRLLYVPADLPLLTAPDLQALIVRNGAGLTLCRALRDNGTNAMLASPPAAANFSFGSNSAERHTATARGAGWAVRVLDLPAFQRDVDEPSDLVWLCRSGCTGAAARYVRDVGVAARLADVPLASAAW